MTYTVLPRNARDVGFCSPAAAASTMVWVPSGRRHDRPYGRCGNGGQDPHPPVQGDTGDPAGGGGGVVIEMRSAVDADARGVIAAVTRAAVTNNAIR